MADYRTVRGAHRMTVGRDELLSNTHFDGRDKGVRITVNNPCRIERVAITDVRVHPAPIHVNLDDGETAVIDRLYISNVNDNGIFVHEQHAGTLLIRRYYIKNAIEDAIYASPPGNPTYASGKADPDGGAGGVVEIHDSYAENCGDYSFRVGSEDSLVENCTARNTTHGGANLYATGDGATFRDCDFEARNAIKHIDHDPRNVGKWPEIVVTNLENVRGKWTDNDVLVHRTAAGAGVVNGRVKPNPDLSPPKGCPTSVAEAVGATPIDDAGEIDSKNESKPKNPKNPKKPDLPHELVLGGSGSNSTSVRWLALVTGQARQHPAFAETDPSRGEQRDVAIGGLAAGWMLPAFEDGLQFSGDLSLLLVVDGTNAPAPVDARLDGDPLVATPEGFAGVWVSDAMRMSLETAVGSGIDEFRSDLVSFIDGWQA